MSWVVIVYVWILLQTSARLDRWDNLQRASYAPPPHMFSMLVQPLTTFSATTQGWGRLVMPYQLFICRIHVHAMSCGSWVDRPSVSDRGCWLTIAEVVLFPQHLITCVYYATSIIATDPHVNRDYNLTGEKQTCSPPRVYWKIASRQRTYLKNSHLL